MQEIEVGLKDTLCCALRKWRKILVFAIVCAVLAGSLVAITRAVNMKDEQRTAKRKAEYEIAYGAYWAPIHELERKISRNKYLAAQAQASIEELDGAKAEYEAEIADLEARISYYESLIADHEASIGRLKLEQEKLNYSLAYRQEQNANSLFMKIDPDDVKVYEAYLRVDSGYQILPGNDYQNPNFTEELRQTYRLLVTGTGFYEKMIADLALNTEVRYVTEIVTVENYSTNSLHVRVIGRDAAETKRIGEYVTDAIAAAKDQVAVTVAEHTLTEYSTNEYAVTDVAIYNRQNAFLQEVNNYEASLRSVSISVLQTQVKIGELNADIEGFRQQITETELTIVNLPHEKTMLEHQIGSYEDDNYKLRDELLKLKKKPAPVYEEYTAWTVFTGFVKFGALGGFIGAVISALYFIIVAAMCSKVLSSEQLCTAVNGEFFGFWPKTEKKIFSFVDRHIARLSGAMPKTATEESAKELVLSNVALSCKEGIKILLCGGASKKTIDAVAAAVKEMRSDIEVISGGLLSSDPAAVRGLAACDAVVLVEQLDISDLHSATQLKDRAGTMNKPLLGVVLS